MTKPPEECVPCLHIDVPQLVNRGSLYFCKPPSSVSYHTRVVSLVSWIDVFVEYRETFSKFWVSSVWGKIAENSPIPYTCESWLTPILHQQGKTQVFPSSTICQPHWSALPSRTAGMRMTICVDSFNLQRFLSWKGHFVEKHELPSLILSVCYQIHKMDYYSKSDCLCHIRFILQPSFLVYLKYFVLENGLVSSTLAFIKSVLQIPNNRRIIRPG